jgi:hypothetical protein
MACVDLTDVPLALLPTTSPREKWIDAVGTLDAYSFVTKRTAESALDLHRLVHLSTRGFFQAVWVEDHCFAVESPKSAEVLAWQWGIPGISWTRISGKPQQLMAWRASVTASSTYQMRQQVSNITSCVCIYLCSKGKHYSKYIPKLYPWLDLTAAKYRSGTECRLADTRGP